MLRRISVLPKNSALISRAMSGGEWGSGKGKGGGSGGSIRDAGGSFGKMESAREEEFFRRQQKEQLDRIKTHVTDEIEQHKRLIKQHEEEIKRHQQKLAELEH